jgi:hypothetical protein
VVRDRRRRAGARRSSNAWVDFAGAYSQTAMRKINGDVELRGLVKSGVIGSAIFTLPAGWRPASSLLMATISNGAFGSVQIDNTGVVTPRSATTRTCRSSTFASRPEG